jgi:signal transduction histidine kinase
MSPGQKAKREFTWALILLVVGGLAAGWVVLRLYRSEVMVRHTYDVELAIDDLESQLNDAGRDRTLYVNDNQPDTLKQFDESFHKVSPALARIRFLTRDNPSQQALCAQLESNAAQRLQQYKESVQLVEQNQSSPERQSQYSSALAAIAADGDEITRQMRVGENRLLIRRSLLSDVLLAIVAVIVLLSFALSAYMFWLYYGVTNRELEERAAAEAQLRRLSLQLMRAQDEIQRKFARELHDGLGQSLASAKMMLDCMNVDVGAQPEVNEIAEILSDAIAQTRTISHLFHPPFLDEVGFASAAKWLLDGYSRRNSVTVTGSIQEFVPRLPRNLEITMYRVLQEALTNAHRHAKTARIEVTALFDGTLVTLRVRDFGSGIPSSKLEALEANSGSLGVGLTGMRERIHEQGGRLKITSTSAGTEIEVTIPIASHMKLESPAPAQSVL